MREFIRELTINTNTQMAEQINQTLLNISVWRALIFFFYTLEDRN